MERTLSWGRKLKNNPPLTPVRSSLTTPFLNSHFLTHSYNHELRPPHSRGRNSPPPNRVTQHRQRKAVSSIGARASCQNSFFFPTISIPPHLAIPTPVLVHRLRVNFISAVILQRVWAWVLEFPFFALANIQREDFIKSVFSLTNLRLKLARFFLALSRSFCV